MEDMVNAKKRRNKSLTVIGQRLAALRGDRSQAEFAEKLGVTQAMISLYERGLVPRSWLFLANLSNRADVDITWLLTGRDRAA